MNHWHVLFITAGVFLVSYLILLYGMVRWKARKRTRWIVEEAPREDS